MVVSWLIVTFCALIITLFTKEQMCCKQHTELSEQETEQAGSLGSINYAV